MILKWLLKFTALYICYCKDMLNFKFCISIKSKKIHKIMFIINSSYNHNFKFL